MLGIYKKLPPPVKYRVFGFRLRLVRPEEYKAEMRFSKYVCMLIIDHVVYWKQIMVIISLFIKFTF